jgi:hypothetical protein
MEFSEATAGRAIDQVRVRDQSQDRQGPRGQILGQFAVTRRRGDRMRRREFITRVGIKLGIDVGQTTVARYMARRRQPPSQGWKTFLRNHADGIASMDLFVVPTITFRLLYGFLIPQHSRRELVWLGVTARPGAHWIARQLIEAYGWQQTPRYIIRDRDCVYGDVFIQRLRAMGIRDRPISPRSPWIFGEADRVDPTGLSRPCCSVWRTTSPPSAQFVPKILQ